MLRPLQHFSVCLVCVFSCLHTCRVSSRGAVLLTDIAEHDRQEDETVTRAQHDDTQVHAEVEHLREIYV